VPDAQAPWLLVAAALVGGAVGWWLVETYDRPFAPPDELVQIQRKLGGVTLTPEENTRLSELTVSHEGRNAGAAFAFVGAALAACIGSSAGLAGRRWGTAFLGLPAGIALGALVGWAAGWAAVLANHHLKMTLGLDGLYVAVLTHAAAWAVIALPLGLLAWLGLRGRVSLVETVAMAVVGAALGALVYPVVAALAFQMSNSELAVPSGHWNRLVWIETAAVLISAMTAAGLTRRRAGRPRPA
jgi:hypothetical protein